VRRKEQRVDLHNKRNALVAALAVVLGLTFWFDGGLSHNAHDDLQMIDGTWTEEGGPPGNSVRLYSVPARMPKDYVGLAAYEGRATLLKHFGQERIDTIWNYENFDPLRLNIDIPGHARFAAIKVLDPDHLLLRFGSDIGALSREDVLRHPDTKRLTRTEGRGMAR